MIYDPSGTLIYDVIEPDPMGVVLQNNGAYFIGTVIDLEEKTVQSLVCDRSTGDVFKTEMRSFTGELNLPVLQISSWECMQIVTTLPEDLMIGFTKRILSDD